MNGYKSLEITKQGMEKRITNGSNGAAAGL
jgi:hypothetical protein